MKTIKQISENLGVSKQAVQKRIAREPLKTQIKPYVHMHGNAKYIADTGIDMIASVFESEPTTKSEKVYTTAIDTGIDAIDKTIDTIDKTIDMGIDAIDKTIDKGIDTIDASIDTGNQTIDKSIIEILQKEMDIKNGQIAELTAANRELTAALENTTASLRAAQALHAGTMQHLADADADAPSERPERPKGFFARLFGKRGE